MYKSRRKNCNSLLNLNTYLLLSQFFFFCMAYLVSTREMEIYEIYDDFSQNAAVYHLWQFDIIRYIRVKQLQHI